MNDPDPKKPDAQRPKVEGAEAKGVAAAFQPDASQPDAFQGASTARTRQVALTDQSGNALVDQQGNLLTVEKPVPDDAGAELESAPTPRTKVGKAVLENRVHIVLNLEALLLLIDDKLAALRAQRPNSDEANHQIEHYENLKRSVETFHTTSLDFSAGRTGEDTVVASTTSFADGLKTWWTERHVEICDRAFDLALFTLGVGVCCMAGAGGVVAAAVSGAVVKGQPVVDAIKAALPKKNN